MIQFDASLAAVVITILLALLGFAGACSILSEKTKQNQENLKKFTEENREDHKLIFSKLEEIRQDIQR